jgi:Flp pilus assembly protein TadB
LLLYVRMNVIERIFLLNLVFAIGFPYIRTVICPLRQLFCTLLFALWIVFGIFIVKNSTLGLIIWSSSVIVFAQLSDWYLNSRKMKKILSQLNPFLLRILLSLKVGSSLRDTIRVEISHEDKYFREVMTEILLSVEKRVIFHHPLRQISQFYELFAHLDREPAKIVTRIELFRKKIDCEERFSAKVAQILSQPRAQALVVGLLYLALVLFLQFNFKTHEWRPYLFLSAPLFVTGQLILLSMGRQYKWKV